MNYHQVTLLGRATSDAKTISTKDKKQFAAFSIAVNSFWGKEKQKDSDTTFYDCMVFGDKQIPKVMDHVKKGDLVQVYGTPSVSAYLNSKKEAKASMKVIVKEYQALK